MAGKWCVQLKGGLYKNKTILFRSWVLLLVKLISPMIGVFLVLIIQGLFKNANDVEHPSVIKQDELALCKDYGYRNVGDQEKNCIDIMYAPDTQFVQDMIDYIGNKYAPDLLDNSTSYLVAVGKPGDIYDFVEDTTLRVSNAFAFDSLPSCSSISLTLFYNQTTASSFSLPPNWSNRFGIYLLEAIANICNVEWQEEGKQLDSVSSHNYTDILNSRDPFVSQEDGTYSQLAEAHYNQPNTIVKASATAVPSSVSFNYDTKLYPQTIVQPQDIFYTMTLEVIVFCTMMVPMCILVVEMVSEREIGIRQIMYQSGYSDAVDILTWLIPQIIVGTIASVLVWVVGYSCGFALFLFTDPTILIVLFFLFNLSSTAFFIFMSSFFATVRSSVIGMILSIAVALIFETMMCGTCIYAADLKSSGWLTTLLYYIITIFPMYPYSIVLFVIGSANQRVVISNTVINPPIFTWKDMATQWDACISLECELFVPINELGLFLIQTILFLLLAWYCSFTIGKGHGHKLGCLFCLNPRFWSNRKYKIQQNPHNPQPTNTSKGTHNPYVSGDIREGFEDEQLEINKEAYPGVVGSAITINGLGKTYTAHGRPPFTAVRSLYLTVPEYTCFCLLGRNGAGKSTTIGMLTSNIKITRGDALLDGWNLKDESERIRSLVGICPQFSIFFPRLTVFEHMKFFCMLRGVDCAKWRNVSFDEPTKKKKGRRESQKRRLIKAAKGIDGVMETAPNSSSGEGGVDAVRGDVGVNSELNRSRVGEGTARDRRDNNNNNNRVDVKHQGLFQLSGEELNPITQLLNAVGLLEFSNKLSSQLSGGMQRRLTVCMTLIGNPSLVFMDEPTTGLDPINAREIIRLLSERRDGDSSETNNFGNNGGADGGRAKSGVKPSTIILTTHSMSECELLSDSVAIIEQGSALCIGETVKLKQRYGTGYRLSIVVGCGGESCVQNPEANKVGKLSPEGTDGADNNEGAAEIDSEKSEITTRKEQLIRVIGSIHKGAVLVGQSPNIEYIIPDESETCDDLVKLLEYLEFLCPASLKPKDGAQAKDPTDGNESGMAEKPLGDFEFVPGVKSWIVRNSRFEDVFLAMVSGKWKGKAQKKGGK